MDAAVTLIEYLLLTSATDFLLKLLEFFFINLMHIPKMSLWFLIFDL